MTSMVTSASSYGVARISSPHSRDSQTAIDLRGLKKAKRAVDTKSSSSLNDNGLLHHAVRISPIEFAKRLGTGCPGWFAESIYAPFGRKIELEFRGPVHLLVMYHDGFRRDGEAPVDGCAPSKSRNLTKKLTFVPAGCAYRERLETAASACLTLLYLDPTVLQNGAEVDHAAKVHFKDSDVWETAAKLKSAIENGQVRTPVYLSALSSVLAVELFRRVDNSERDLAPNRGGLACWQKRAVVSYIEEHFGEQVCLVKLAQLARLSTHHFCRAFKRSFGVPPHQFQVRRRMEQAKLLLADPSTSITEVGLAVGYSQTSSFSVAFRNFTGWTPSEYRREFK
jgi:AraC family transcriptional regulator